MIDLYILRKLNGNVIEYSTFVDENVRFVVSEINYNITFLENSLTMDIDELCLFSSYSRMLVKYY